MHATTAISWFEIPARDLERAVWFYESVLQQSLTREIHDRAGGSAEMAVFPYAEGNVGGCLTRSAHHFPAEGGSVVYLRTARLDETLARVERAGGRILIGKTPLPDGMGWYAHFVDSEGNQVGLHGMQ